MKIKQLLAAMLLPAVALASTDHNGFDHNNDPYLVRFIKNPTGTINLAYQGQLMQQENWTTFVNHNPNWNTSFNEQTGLPHNAYGPGISMGISLTPQATAYGFITTKLSGFNLPVGELVYRNTASNLKYHNVDYVQYHNGLEVMWSIVKIKMTKDGRIVQFMLDAYNDITTGNNPTISVQAAQGFATAGLNLTINNVSTDAKLKYLPVPNGRKNDYHLVYAVTVDATDAEDLPRKYYTLVDANNGQVLYRQNRVNFFDANAPKASPAAPSANMDINVSASLYATHLFNPTSVEPLKYIAIPISSFTYYADSAGYLGVANTSPVTSTIPLRGTWCRIENNGVMPTQTFTLNPGTNNITFSNTGLEELSAYHSVNEIHDYYKEKSTISGTFSDQVMDFVMTTNVEVAGSCNAFYNGDVNFYVADATCNATSLIADVVYHEYGHGINYEVYSFFGGFFSNGALGEGYADTWANGRTEDPVLGIGFYVGNPTGFVRRYDQAPAVLSGLTGEVHADGEIIAGAWWDVGVNFGNHQQRQDLFFQTLPAVLDQPDGAEAILYSDILTEALINDDNDGNLSNGTPNYCDIVSAFARHEIFQGGASTLFTHSEVLQAPGQVPIQTNIINVAIPGGSNPSGYYRVQGTTAWNPFSINNIGGNNFQGTIPAHPNGTILEYYVDLIDNFCNFHYYVKPSGVVDSVPNIPYYILVGYNLLDQDYFSSGANGWAAGQPGDNATTGIWTYASPVASYLDPAQQTGQVQTGSDHTTTNDNICAVTGNATIGDGAGTQDIDGGKTTLVSRTFDLSSYTAPAITYWRWYSNDQGATPGTDFWQVAISNDGGITWTPVENTNVADHSWRRFAFKVTDYVTPTANVKVRFIAEDANAGSLVEAALDDFEVWDAEPQGINETALAAWFVSPNPSKDVMNVGWVGNAKNILLQITDNTGRTVYSKKFDNSLTKYTVDVKNFANGIYTVRLTADGVSEVKKITVIK